MKKAQLYIEIMCFGRQNHKLILFLIILVTMACNREKNGRDSGLLNDPFIPLNMEPDTTIITASDYIPDFSSIDSVAVTGNNNVLFSGDKKTITVISGTKTEPFSLLYIYCKSYQYSLVLMRSEKQRTELRFPDPLKKSTSVFAAGDFNNWNPSSTPFSYDGKEWKANLNLSPGTYAYQLVIDSIWMLDPSNPQKVSNNMGGTNSVLKAGQVKHPETPFLTSTYADGRIIKIETTGKVDNYIVLWNNLEITWQHTSRNGNELEIVIPDFSADYPEAEIRVFAYNEHGPANDVLIPIKYGNVVKNTRDIRRTDRHAMTMYFLMPDRFCNGDESNDFPVKDQSISFKANYQGGDLAGIKKKVNSEYFNDLGINTVWLSPVVRNPDKGYIEYPEPHRKYSGYHGYWPVSFSTVDYRFGNEALFKDLVKEAHGKELNILVDFVSNHVHELHPLYRMHPDWTTPVDLPDGRKNIRLWDEQRLTTWFDTFLPDLNYNKPEVVDAVSDSAMLWIKNMDIDGFRHDATKHVPEVFWRALTMKMKKHRAKQPKKMLYQIGETFGNRELIGSYVGSGMQDGQFDFNLYFDARSVFVNDEEPFTKLSASLQQSFNYYGYHSLMGNISGNHDIARFISYASGAMKFTDDDKAVGWTKNISVTNPIGYRKLAQLMAFITTIPGIPVIYYGDEYGMPGAGDPDNRRMMKFSGLNAHEMEQLDITRKLFRLRKENMALLYGDFNSLLESNKVWCYSRYYFSDAVFIFFNKSSKKERVQVTIPDRFSQRSFSKLMNSVWDIRDNKLSVELEPHSFEVFSVR